MKLKVLYFDLTRLADDDDGAAKTGVTETTREKAVYSHPTNEKIKFWDLPGIGMYQLLVYCTDIMKTIVIVVSRKLH